MSVEETPPLPPAADGSPSEPAVAPPAAPPADESPSVASEPVTPRAPVLGDTAHRGRRRRRRRPPRAPGSAPTPASGRSPDILARDAGASAAAAEGEPGGEAAAEGADVAVTAAASTADDPTPGRGPIADAAAIRPRRHRRRRRRPPLGGFGSAPAPGALGSALPPPDADAASAAGGDAASTDGADGAAGAGDGSQRPTLHLRRPVRGRRQLPRPPGLQQGANESPAGAGGEPQQDAALSAEAASAGGNAGAGPRPAGEFPRRRRRRRPIARGGDAASALEGQSPVTSQQAAERTPRARARDRRDAIAPREAHGPRFGGQSERSPGGARGNGAERAPEHGGRGERGDRGRGERGDRDRRDRRPGGPRDGRRGRGREEPRRVEQKLYALESMVDRGFEDIPDDAAENGSRRVHWTIVKRSVADQKSGKAMSATYVLQRDGGETEFPNLGAARAAANKTIVHPEKLTMSKAEHAAEHAAAKSSR